MASRQDPWGPTNTSPMEDLRRLRGLARDAYLPPAPLRPPDWAALREFARMLAEEREDPNG